MATALDLFPQRVAWVDENRRLTPEAFRALNAVFTRIGGSNGPSTTDLASADDDDSGLEEFKHETSKALDALAMSPLAQPLIEAQVQIEQLQSEVSSLRDALAELVKHVHGIEQEVNFGSHS